MIPSRGNIPEAELGLTPALQLTAYSLRCAALRSGFRQQLKAGVRLSETGILNQQPKVEMVRW